MYANLFLFFRFCCFIFFCFANSVSLRFPFHCPFLPYLFIFWFFFNFPLCCSDIAVRLMSSSVYWKSFTLAKLFIMEPIQCEKQPHLSVIQSWLTTTVAYDMRFAFKDKGFSHRFPLACIFLSWQSSQKQSWLTDWNCLKLKKDAKRNELKSIFYNFVIQFLFAFTFVTKLCVLLFNLSLLFPLSSFKSIYLCFSSTVQFYCFLFNVVFIIVSL